jgi:hypothetical protein
MSHKTDLPPECGKMLGLAVHAAMTMLGGETMLVDEDDNVTLIRLARVGTQLVLIERPGDPATGQLHDFTGYRIAEAEPGEPFKLDAGGVLFMLREQGFYSPPDWHLELIEDPRGWFNATMAPIHSCA